MCFQHIGLLDTLGHIGISQCVPQCARATMCFAMCFLRVSQCVQNTLTFNGRQCASNVFSMCFLHIETHWNTLKHIVVIVAKLHKNVPDYNVFQCVVMCANVRSKHIQCASMCLQFFFNVFYAHWDFAVFSMCQKSIEKKLEAHWRPFNVFLIAPHY